MAGEQDPSNEIRKELDRQAEARARMVRWDDVARTIREISGLRPLERVLDVACGDGVLAFELGPHCAYVQGVDRSDSMIALAVEHAIEASAQNVSFQIGDAEALEFDDSSFDRVYCRLGVHHFGDPVKAIREMVRVVRKPGHVILADLISSDDASAREAHNRIEKSRDPTHVSMLSPRQLRGLAVESGLTLEQELTWQTRRRFADWMKRVGADQGRINKTRRLMLEAARRQTTDLDIAGGENSLEFTHRWMVLRTLALA